MTTAKEYDEAMMRLVTRATVALELIADRLAPIVASLMDEPMPSAGDKIAAGYAQAGRELAEARGAELAGQVRETEARAAFHAADAALAAKSMTVMAGMPSVAPPVAASAPVEAVPVQTTARLIQRGLTADVAMALAGLSDEAQDPAMAKAIKALGVATLGQAGFDQAKAAVGIETGMCPTAKQLRTFVLEHMKAQG